MPGNIYFNILKSYRDSRLNISSSSSSSSTTSSKNETLPKVIFKENLTLIELGRPKVVGLDYEFVDTHMTFVADGEPDELGYHYTAKVIKDEEEVTVHVFFYQDGRSAVIGGDFNQKERDIFLALAEQHCPPIIEQIKEYQKKRISELKGAIKGLFELNKTTSVAGITNTQEVDRLGEQFLGALSMVKELRAIGGSTRLGKVAIQKRLQTLNWLKSDVQPHEETTITESASVESEYYKEKVVESKSTKSKRTRYKPQTLFSETPKASEVTLKMEAYKDFQKNLSELIKLDRSFETLIASIDEGTVYPFSELHQANNLVQKTIASLDAYSVYEDELSLLDSLIIEAALRMSHHLNVYCLEHLLVNNKNPKIPDSLTPFIKFLPEDAISYALHYRNNKLLGQILNGGNITVDNINNIDVEAFQPIGYTYLTNNVQAFKQLLKFKPNLNVAADSEGTRFLDLIIKLPQHDPFRMALDSFSGRKAQAEQTVVLFNKVKLKPGVTPSQCKLVDQAIQKIQKFIDIPEPKTDKQTKLFNNAWYGFTNVLDPKFSGSPLQYENIQVALADLIREGNVVKTLKKRNFKEMILKTAEFIEEIRTLRQIDSTDTVSSEVLKLAELSLS